MNIPLYITVNCVCVCLQYEASEHIEVASSSTDDIKVQLEILENQRRTLLHIGRV